jgi:hypothetical protein
MGYAAMFEVVVPIKAMSVDLATVWAADVHRKVVSSHNIGLVLW